MIATSFTFGVRYRPDGDNYEVHPVWPSATGQGWLVVMAEDYSTARSVTHRMLEGKFAFDYPGAKPKDWERHYPVGEIATVYVTDETVALADYGRATYTVDSLGIGHPDQGGRYALYLGQVMVAEFEFSGGDDDRQGLALAAQRVLDDE